MEQRGLLFMLFTTVKELRITNCRFALKLSFGIIGISKSA